MRLAGIEIGGTKLQVVLGDEHGVIQKRVRMDVVAGNGAPGIQRQIMSGMREIAGSQSLDGIGVGFGGPIDWRNGTVFKSHHISGWDGFALGSWLSGEWKAPVFVDNDANVAAFAEARTGNGRDRSPVFYMTIGSGVGGGIVVDGQIYHGRFPGEVEVGHTRIPLGDDPAQWPILEECCSGWSLDRQIREIARSHPSSPLGGLVSNDDGKEARHLLSAMKAGDAEACALWERWTKFLVLGLSHVVHLFHPEILILGGGVTGMGVPLLNEIRARLATCVMKAYEGTCRVELAAHGEDVVPVGALLLAAEGLKR